jgi:hypothetical protein
MQLKSRPSLPFPLSAKALVLVSNATDELIINAVDREELDFLDHLFLSNEDLTVYNSSSAAAKTMILLLSLWNWLSTKCGRSSRWKRW